MHGGAAGRYITYLPHQYYIYMYTLVASLITYYISIYILIREVYLSLRTAATSSRATSTCCSTTAVRKEKTQLLFLRFFLWLS